MSYLILVRHGQSIWNLEKRFTGWVDVDLTENGKLEAKKEGRKIVAVKFVFKKTRIHKVVNQKSPLKYRD